MKDEKEHHGAVVEPSSEQQFHKSDAITFVVCKIWSHTPSTNEFMAGLQAGSQTIHWLVDLLKFLADWIAMEIQYYYCVTNKV